MNKSLVHILPVALLAMSLQANAQGASHETVDVVGQSSAGPVVSEDGATIIRTKNGITASLKMPTPIPGSYTYPDGNAFQPFVFVGHPEVFTGWIFIFNNPAECSDGVCGSDDLGPTPARGGAHNFAGHSVRRRGSSGCSSARDGATRFPACANIEAYRKSGSLVGSNLPALIRSNPVLRHHWERMMGRRSEKVRAVHIDDSFGCCIDAFTRIGRYWRRAIVL
jgi:hypothetical protein